MQGRFKRDGSGSPQPRQGRADAPAEQEPRAGTDRGPSASHTPNQGQGPTGSGGDGSRRTSAAAASAEPSDAPPKARAENEVGPRIALRNWRISTRLVALLTLPVVAATTLGGIRISESLQDMEQLDHMQLLTKLTREATDLAQALQSERDLSAGPLANGRPVSDYQVANPRRKTDREYKAFLEATEAIPATEGDEALRSIRQNVSQIASQVIQLNTIRGNAYEKGVSNSVTVEAYSRLIRSLLSLSQDMAQATSNPEMIKRTRALAAFSSAKEYASIQQAIIAAALPASDKTSGRVQQGDRLYGEAALNSEGVELKSFQAIYESTGGDATDRTASLNNGNPSITAAEKYAERVLNSDDAMPTGPKRGHLNFTDEYGTKIAAMNRIERGLLGDMETMARELRQESQREAIINGALILLVLGVSLIGAFVVARSMIRSLRRPPGHRDQGRPGTSARARQAALRVRPAGRRHLRRVRRCALPGRDRPGGRGLRRRAPRGRPSRRRAGPPPGQRQRDVHQPLAPFPGPHPASALAHLRAGVARGRPGPAVLALQARPPRDAYAP